MNRVEVRDEVRTNESHAVAHAVANPGRPRPDPLTILLAALVSGVVAWLLK